MLFCYTISFAQKSDSELFFDFKNELKSLKNSYKNNYKTGKLNDENRIKNNINSFVEKIYLDYQNKDSEKLKATLTGVKENINRYSSDRDKEKNDFILKIDQFLKKWNDQSLKAKITKVAKDYDMDIDEGLESASEIKSDLELESSENYQKIAQFLEIIIQDKVELLKLRNEITELENKIKSKATQVGKDKKTIADLLADNSRRKDLIFRLIQTIVNEHKLIESTDYSNSAFPSPYGSDVFNLLNGFMDDYINLSRNLQGDVDPGSLNSSLAAYMDVNMKLDSLYEDMEKAQMIKNGEKEDLLAKSHLWENQIFNVLDNGILSEFTSKNIPIVFQKTDKNDWFSKSLIDFITPYTNPNDPVNQDKEKSKENRIKFEEAWNSIKTKWISPLKTAKYLDDKIIAEVDNKLIQWKDNTGDSINVNYIIIGIIAILIIAVVAIMRRFKRR